MGLPYEQLSELSVREQRVIVKRRIMEMRMAENEKIRANSKSPTVALDTKTNTRMFMQKTQQARHTVMSSREEDIMANIEASRMLESKFIQRRSRSNLPYSKKPSSTRNQSEMSEAFGSSTATTTIRNTAVQSIAA